MKKLVVILAIGVATAGAVTTTLWLDLRTERNRAGEIATRLAAVESMQPAHAAAPQALAPAMPVVALTAPPSVAAPAATATASSSQQSASQSGDSPMKGILEAMSTPEAQDAMRSSMRREMTRMYPDIEQELGITAQEKQKLFDLMADQDRDINGMMLAMQDPAAAREMQRKMVEEERTHEAKVSALLGSKYPKWEEYKGTVAARQEVDDLRRTLSAGRIPLSETQSTQLVTSFATEMRRNSRDEREWNSSSAALNSPDLMRETMQREVDSQNRLVDVASRVLSSAQLDRYKRQVEQEANMMRAAMEMMTGGSKP
jgi:hypothetical protein